MVVAIAVVLSLGTWGVLLAVIGHYKAQLAIPLGLVTAAVLALLAWPRRSAASDVQASNGPRSGMLVVAAGSFVFNGLHSGQFVVITRDPGIYAAAAKWLQHDGSLEVSAGDVWLSKGSGLFNWASSGMYPEGLHNNFLEFQFSHFAPSLFAMAGSVFGDRGLFAMPALLGALGLCAVYSAGCRLVGRPWLVLAAVAGLAVSLPQISVSRDTYSETSAQFLLWSGLWLLLVAFERRKLGVALLAGLAIGGTLLARVDALVYFIPLPAAAIAAYIASGAEIRRFLVKMYANRLAAAAALAVLAVIDLDVRSTWLLPGPGRPGAAALGCTDRSDGWRGRGGRHLEQERQCARPFHQTQAFDCDRAGLRRRLWSDSRVDFTPRAAAPTPAGQCHHGACPGQGRPAGGSDPALFRADDDVGHVVPRWDHDRAGHRGCWSAVAATRRQA